jgi:hypothetical protein
MSEGARVWLVPAGFIPAESTGAQDSHEAICVLNTSGEQARLSVPFYFEDRDPLKEVVVIVPPGRTVHIRTNEMDGVEIPRGVPYAVLVEARVPVTVQCSWMDTSQAALSLMTAMAYPVER